MLFKSMESRKSRETEAAKIINQLKLLPTDFYLDNKSLIINCLSLGMEDSAAAAKKIDELLGRAKELGLIHIYDNGDDKKVKNEYSEIVIVDGKSMPESLSWPNDGGKSVPLGDAKGLGRIDSGGTKL